MLQAFFACLLFDVVIVIIIHTSCFLLFDACLSLPHINYHYHPAAMVNPCHLDITHFLIDADSTRVKDGIYQANRMRMEGKRNIFFLPSS
jgi:hypothetical protein